MKNMVSKYNRILFWGIFVLASLILSYPVHAASSPKLIGHRGYSGKYMENTIKSMHKAYKAGFNGVEMDLWEAKDHTLWIFHDEDLKDLTGKKGKIYNLKYSNRLKYKLKNGATIPTLDLMLKKLQGNKNIFIHIKGNKNSTLSERAQNEIVSTLKKYHLENNVYIFAKKSLMKKLDFGEISTGWITSKKDSVFLRNMVQKAKDKNVKFILLTKITLFKSKGNGAAFVRYAHKYGIKTGLYCTQSHSDYKYLKKIKADYALSNYYVK